MFIKLKQNFYHNMVWYYFTFTKIDFSDFQWLKDNLEKGSEKLLMCNKISMIKDIFVFLIK